MQGAGARVRGVTGGGGERGIIEFGVLGLTDAIIPALTHRIHQNFEVKSAWARVVLGWVTPWEVLVFHPFLFFFLKNLV